MKYDMKICKFNEEKVILPVILVHDPKVLGDVDPRALLPEVAVGHRTHELVRPLNPLSLVR